MSSASESDRELLSLLEIDSDDEENITTRDYKVRSNYISTLSSAEFQIRFRLDKTSVEELLVQIYPALRVKGARNHGVAPLNQILLALRFYALGTTLLSVADFVGVSKTSASRIIHDVSKAIAGLYSKYIKIMPQQSTCYGFFRIAKFPRVFGAVDCTHIKVHSPCSEIGEEFRNRKGYFSVNVQAVCTADLLFINMVARWPGSAHDATIFNSSELRAQCESGLFGDTWLLGDSAYPLKPYLLTPLLAPVTTGEIIYNEGHIKTRNCIERCFGVWKRRFPVLGLTMRLGITRANAVIVATGVLHNICRLNRLEEVDPEVTLPENVEVPLSDYSEEANNSPENSSARDRLIEEYFNYL